jgi:hypothetical protein
MLTSGVMLIHDNAHPHTAARTQTLLNVNWMLSDHPLYSSHFAPNDYHLFTYLNNWLRLQHFNNNGLMKDVKTWLTSQVADLFDTDTKTLQVPQFRR